MMSRHRMIGIVSKARKIEQSGSKAVVYAYLNETTGPTCSKNDFSCSSVASNGIFPTKNEKKHFLWIHSCMVTRVLKLRRL